LRITKLNARQYSDIDGEAADDASGSSVSLSADGSVVAIGALRNDGNGMFSGHVRVFQNVSGAWVQVGSDIDGEAADDGSGSVSLSADGSVVAIGALSDQGNGVDSGHVRVFQNVSGAWTQVGSDIDGEAADDGSGFSVSLSADGSVVAIGAEFNDGNGVDSGHVRLFRFGDIATEPPIIRTPIWSQTSGFSATLHGQAQTIYRIQWSTDLKDWFDLTSFVSDSTETPFQDPRELGTEQRRFYQALSP
jgi:Flp pilus assembly pilin Flp